MKNFISTAEAAELLLWAGFAVKIDNGGKHAALLADDVIVAWGYKDGTSWRFKTELIELFIENTKPKASKVVEKTVVSLAKKSPFDIPSYKDSLKADFEKGLLSVEQVALELHKGGYKNYVCVDFAKKVLGLSA